MNNMTTISSLPFELLELLLSYIPSKPLFLLQRVSKLWKFCIIRLRKPIQIDCSHSTSPAKSTNSVFLLNDHLYINEIDSFDLPFLDSKVIDYQFHTNIETIMNCVRKPSKIKLRCIQQVNGSIYFIRSHPYEHNIQIIKDGIMKSFYSYLYEDMIVFHEPTTIIVTSNNIILSIENSIIQVLKQDGTTLINLGNIRLRSIPKDLFVNSFNTLFVYNEDHLDIYDLNITKDRSIKFNKFVNFVKSIEYDKFIKYNRITTNNNINGITTDVVFDTNPLFSTISTVLEFSKLSKDNTIILIYQSLLVLVDRIFLKLFIYPI